MDRYAVVGNPVAHSLSPQIHAAFAAATGQALRYERLHAPVDGFAATVEAFFAAGGAGLNVTVPFKEAAARWVDVLDPDAAAAGAVNTIVREGARFRGFNTDGQGLVRDLTGNWQLDLRGVRLLLLGAGGAARGVLRPLLEQAPERLVIANRTAARAQALAAAVSSSTRTSVAGGGHELAVGRFDLVINATSAGLQHEAVTPCPPAVVRGAFCYDMIYAAPDGAAGGAAPVTAFCRWCAANGARSAVDGLGMLVEQAALAFALWRGVTPETGPVLAQLRAPGPTHRADRSFE
jgi:shikimate dehydrogenase